jgi:hypothetical protein
MIIYNEYPEYQKIAEEIDKELYYVNLVIKRLPKGNTPVNICGIIFIDDWNSKEYFASELTHEAGHSVFDPITTLNYIECTYEVFKELSKRYNVDGETLQTIVNVTSDIINDYQISKNKKLSEIRRKGIDLALCDDIIFTNVVTNPILRELAGVYRELHGINFPIPTKLHEKIIEILKKETDRKKQYVEISKLLMEELEKEVNKELKKEGSKNSSDKEKKIKKKIEEVKKYIKEPIKIDKKEYEKNKKEIMKRAKDYDEAKKKIEILKNLVEDENPIKESYIENLLQFYQEKANQVMIQLDYPTKPSFEAVKVGSKLWRPSDGIKNIDIKRTMIKFGVNIPLVTTRTARIFPKGLSSIMSQKPIDLVLSIDTSSSTNIPVGSMDSASDYEYITAIAIMDYAKRINQRIGVTLWADYIMYTTLPQTYDWREIENLKREILENWKGYWTHIKYALEQSTQFKDKLFFIFTDGDVEFYELEQYKDQLDNVMFFLIRPHDLHYEEFVKMCGESRVIRINKIEDIPTVTLKFYKSLFKVG